MTDLTRDNIGFPPLKARHQSADASGGEQTIIAAPGTGKYIYVYDIIVSVGAAMTVNIREDGTTIVTLYLAQNGGGISNLQVPFKLAANKAFKYQTSAVGNVSITATYKIYNR